MLGAEMLRDAARVRKLVVRRLAKTDRERLYRLRQMAAHQRDDDARIEAARKERAERYVRNEAARHRFVELRRELVLGGALVERCRILPFERPVAAERDPAVAIGEVMRRRDLLHVSEDAAGIRHVAVRDVRADRRMIERA